MVLWSTFRPALGKMRQDVQYVFLENAYTQLITHALIGFHMLGKGTGVASM